MFSHSHLVRTVSVGLGLGHQFRMLVVLTSNGAVAADGSGHHVRPGTLRILVSLSSVSRGAVGEVDIEIVCELVVFLNFPRPSETILLTRSWKASDVGFAVGLGQSGMVKKPEGRCLILMPEVMLSKL